MLTSLDVFTTDRQAATNRDLCVEKKIEYFSESGKSEHIDSPAEKRVARRFLRGGRKSAVTSVRRKFREVNAHLLVHREAHQVQLAPLACPA